MPSRIKCIGGGLKGGSVVGKTARLGGVRRLTGGKTASGFEPAILAQNEWGLVGLIEAGSAGATQDAALIYGAAAVESGLVAGRPNGYLYGGASAGNRSGYSNAIQKIAFGSVTVSTLGATAPTGKGDASASSNASAGYAVGGDGGGGITNTVHKFSFGTETAAANSSNFTTARGAGGGGYTSGGYGCHVGGVQGSGSSYGYYGYINYTNDAITELYDATLNATTGHANWPYLVTDGVSGYLTGGYDPSFNLSTSILKTQIPSPGTLSVLSATLTNTRVHGQGVSSSTKGYLSAGGYTTNIDLFTFSTETIGTPIASIYSSYCEFFSAVSSGTRGFVCGGAADSNDPVTTIMGIDFATDTASTESAALSTAIDEAAGFDHQAFSAGGAVDSSDGTKIAVQTAGSSESAAADNAQAVTIPTTTGAVVEGAGSAAGFFSGGADSAGYSRGYVHCLRFDVETLELIYHNNFGQNDYAAGYGFGAVSLVDGADMYFLAGKKMIANNPAVLELAYNWSGKVNATTLTVSALITSFSGNDTFYGVGLSYNRFGMGFLIGNPTADSHLIYKYAYSTGTGGSSIYVTPVVGNELTGYYDRGDNGYVFGGTADSSRTARVNMFAESMAVIAATLPAARYRPGCVNSADNALIAGGQNSDGSTTYNSVSGFLGSTETSRTTTASLGVARGGAGTVSGYSKGYVGSSFIPYVYTAQAVDSVAFATETSIQTAMTLSMCGSCGASYTPTQGRTLDTPNGTGTMTTGTTEPVTSGDNIGAGIPFAVSRSDAGNADTTVNGVFAMGVDGSAQATATDTPLANVIFVVDADGQLTLIDSALVFGIDVAQAEPTTAAASQGAAAVFACDAQGVATATAAHPVISVLLFDGQASASAADGPNGLRVLPVSGPEAASAGDTPATILSIGGAVTEAVGATDTPVVAYSGNATEPATATDGLSAIFGRLGTAVAAATATQSATQPNLNVDTVAVATATATVRGYLITSTGGSALGAAEDNSVTTTRLGVAGSASASADHQQTATAAFSAVSVEQASALDTSFATGILTVQATEALYAIVSAYAAIFGNALPSDTHFVVTKVDGHFVVSLLDKNAVLTKPAHVVVLTKNSVNVVKTSLPQMFVKREPGDVD